MTKNYRKIKLGIREFWILSHLPSVCAHFSPVCSDIKLKGLSTTKKKICYTVT